MDYSTLITTKRWNDPQSANDGLRILITRYRPRALPKSEETWDLWLREVAPSPKLLAAFQGKSTAKIDWMTYRAKYLHEMKSATAAIHQLAQRITSGERITLLCSSACIRESRCHRSLLRDLILTDAISTHP